MVVLRTKTCIVIPLCLAFSISLLGQENRGPKTSKSCKEFVGEFYSWYLGLKLKNQGTRTSDLALKAKPDSFSPYLAQQLRKDSAAQDKAGSELVSLDGDPFIGADGPADRYVVKKITFKAGKCWAEVYGVREQEEGKMPEVTPELELKNGRWRFVDFYFPDLSGGKSWSLLGVLKAIRKSENEKPKNNQ